jgi:hypothetical protein
MRPHSPLKGWINLMWVDGWFQEEKILRYRPKILCVHRVDLNENVYALCMFTSCIAILFKNIFSIRYEIIYIVDMNERKNHFSFLLMHTIHLLHFLVLVCMYLNMNFLFLCIAWHASWDLDLLPITKFWIFYISCNNNYFLTIWKIV